MEQVRKVIDTAWGMFRRFGVRSVSMDDVAREMSISKKTLYRCFRDKNDLIIQTINKDLEVIEEQVNKILDAEPHPVKQVLQIANFVSGYLKDVNPSMLYDLQKYHPELHHHFITYRKNTFLEKVMTNLRRGIDQGYYRAEIEVVSVANLYLCLMDHGPEMLAAGKENTNYADLYTQIMKYHLHAIATSAGLQAAETFIQEK